MTLDRRTVLAFAIVGGFFAVLLALLVVPISSDEAIKSIVQLMIGALVGQLVQVYNFDFGSSSGSKAKDDALIDAAKNPPLTKSEPSKS